MYVVKYLGGGCVGKYPSNHNYKTYPAWSATMTTAATRHSLLVNDMASSSVEEGRQMPQISLVRGFMNPDPFPLISPIMTISSSWSGNTLAASLIPPRVFLAL